MDYVLKSKLHCTPCEILDTVSQQPVDLDFTLADYCADIEKILKCSLSPKIFSRTFSAGELRVDGACIVRVLYCDKDKKSLRCCEQTVPFTSTIPVTKEVNEHIILLSARQEYLNCRALNPRRLTVHGAFSLCATIVGRDVCMLQESAEDSDLQVLTKTTDVCELCEFSQEQFSAVESVTLNAKTRVESIIRSDVSAVVTDFSKSAGKLTLKGEITLRMLYISDSSAGECDRFVYVFPFTQTMDSKENDWDISDIRLDVLNFDLLLKTEMLTDDPTLTIDVKLCASVMGYRKSEVTYICDAYSVCDNVELARETRTLCRKVHSLSANTSVKAPVYLGDRKICRILDIYCENPIVNTEIQSEKIRFFGKVNLCILGFTEDGELICVERQIEAEHTESVDDAYSYAKHPRASVTSLSFRMTDNNELELRLDMRLSAVMCIDETVSKVSSVISSGSFVSPMGDSALILYYADKDEKVWDIAKRYCTSMTSISEENELTEDILTSPKMLLILKS